MTNQPMATLQARTDGAAANPSLRLVLATAVAFLVTLALAMTVVWYSEQQRLNELRTRVASLADDHAHAIQRDIEHALSATYALAALVSQGNGDVPGFEDVARQMLPYYHGAASLQLAPGGIVQRIVPLAGNEKAIGHNLLQDPQRNKEAFLARDTGKLTLAGPFDLIQGGLGAVGRLPVFLDDAQGRPVFWGFATVLIRFPDVLEGARLSGMAEQELAYELWRVHPDSGKRQTIAASTAMPQAPVNQAFAMPNGNWTLSVAPVNGWSDAPALAFKILLGFAFSLLLGYLAKLLIEQRMHEQNLGELVVQRTAEMSATQGKLQAIFDAIPDMVWLKDVNGVYLDCNPMFEHFLGMRKADIVGKTDAFVDETQAEHFRECDRMTLASGGPVVNEECLLFAEDDRRGLFEITRTPMRDAGGRLTGVLAIAHDISGRKREEDELRRRELRFRNMSDAAGAYMWEIDANMVYTYVSYQSLNVKGYTPEELLGHTPMEFMPKEEVKSVGEIVGRAIAGKTSFRLQHSDITKDGSLTWEEVYGTPYFDDDGALIGLRGTGMNINVRKRAKEALRQSEQRFRDIAHVSADWIWEVDARGVYTYASESVFALLGYRPEEILGKTPFDFMPENEAMDVAKSFGEIVAAKAPFQDLENTVLGKDGVPHATLTNGMPILDASGELLGYRGVDRDITERKKIERQLQDQQLHLENLVQQRTTELTETVDRIRKITSQVPGLVYQLRMHPDGRFSMPYVSGAIGGIFDLSPHDVRNDIAPMLAKVNPDDRQELLLGIRVSARNTSKWHHEFRIRQEDGSERILMGDALPQSEADGAVLWHGFVTDITERKLAAAALQRAERHTMAIAVSANDAIITADETGRVVGWNPSAERMFGYAESEIVGQSISMLMPPRFRERHDIGLARVAAGGETHMIGKTVELAGLRNDGKEFPLEISLAQYQSEEGWHCSAIIRDITQRKQAEQRLSELSAHLQTVREEEKANIAREIHDELGGTLTALKMNTYWMEEELHAIKGADVLGDYLKSMTHQIDEAVLATRRIITDLRPTLLDDLGLLSAIEWQAEDFYKRTGIVCRVNCVESKGEVDKQHSIALFRIFQEALTNVARHSGASAVEVEYQNDGEELILSISDNGRGMSEDLNVPRTSYGIRGMRERVEQLGGEISFVRPSAGGLGLTVTLPLPRGDLQGQQ